MGKFNLIGEKQLVLLLIALYLALGVKSQGTSCVRNITLLENKSIKVTYFIACKECKDIAQIKDTIIGSYKVVFEEQKNVFFKFNRRKGIIEIAIMNVSPDNLEITYSLLPKKSKSDDFSFNGIFSFVNNEAVKKRIKIKDVENK